MPKFMVDGKMVELDELIEKAEKWDHVVSQSSKDFVNVSETLRKLEAIKTDLVKWSRCHDPPEERKQIHLWCSINRLIGDHFGSDWMEAEG